MKILFLLGIIKWRQSNDPYHEFGWVKDLLTQGGCTRLINTLNPTHSHFYYLLALIFLSLLFFFNFCEL